jgi:hypothetical protein
MNLRRVIEYLRRSTDRTDVVPADQKQADTLQRADELLENPRIKAILSERDRQLRASFARADRRLAGR